MLPNDIIPINLAPARLYVEAVEKVNLNRIRRVGRKCNLSGGTCEQGDVVDK